MENLNDIIAQAVAGSQAPNGAMNGNTGGEPSPITAPNPAPPAPEGPANTAPAPETPAATPEPFDETFDITALAPEEQKAYRYWQGAYTKKRQAEAEKQKELEARYAPYEGVPSEAVEIARDYAARLQSGDVDGAETLLSQQLEALRMLKQQQNGGYDYQPPAGYEQTDPYRQEPDPYDQAPDPVMQRLDAIERRFLVNQIQTEMSQLQAKIGRPLNTLEQQRMLAQKQRNPNLTMEQVYYLSNREAHENTVRQQARDEAIRAFTQSQAAPPPPSGIPGREPVGNAPPTDMRGIIQEAMRTNGF